MNYLKTIIMFGLGGTLGFIGGWYYSKEKYSKIADEEIDSVKHYYLKKHLEEQAKNEEISKKIDEKILETEDKYKEEKKDKEKVKYNKIGVDEKVMAEQESPEEDEPTKPYLITEEEFLNGKNDYEKISLTYYTYDDTLADGYDEMVDVEETISTDIYNQVEDADSDLYVRNPALQTDFEIMKVEASFRERYGGI